MFYAAINTHSNESSMGFHRTWSVIGFQTKANRDKHVKDSNCLATKAITAKQVSKYGGKIGEIHLHEETVAQNNAICKAAEAYWNN